MPSCAALCLTSALQLPLASASGEFSYPLYMDPTATHEQTHKQTSTAPAHTCDFSHVDPVRSLLFRVRWRKCGVVRVSRSAVAGCVRKWKDCSEVLLESKTQRGKYCTNPLCIVFTVNGDFSQWLFPLFPWNHMLEK